MAQLRHHGTDLERLRTRVVVVAFESMQQASAWKEAHTPEWPLLLDWEQKMYRAYGMRRSRWGSSMRANTPLASTRSVATGSTRMR